MIEDSLIQGSIRYKKVIPAAGSRDVADHMHSCVYIAFTRSFT